MRDGMSQVSVNNMVLDEDGLVWIGTADGLNKYDGNMFWSYKHNPDDSTSISGNYINKIEKLPDGNLLIGTRDNGLSLYESQKNIFTRIALSKNIKDATITGIELDHDKGMWVSTIKHGLYYWKDLGARPEVYFRDKTITAIYKDDHNLLWVGDIHGNVYAVMTDFSKPIAQLKIQGSVKCFLRINNFLFIGTQDGFFVYDYSSHETKLLELESSGNFKTMHVADILEDDISGNIWIATSRGDYYFDYRNFRVLEKIGYKKEAGKGLSNNTVQALLKVTPSTLFVGTANELNCLEYQTPVFNNISKNKKGRNILNDNVIFSIYKNNNLWVGTSDGGLNLITQDSVYYYLDNKNLGSSIAGSVIRSIVHDTINQRMWFATVRGLSMLNLKDFDPNHVKFTNFYHDPQNPNSINSNFIKDLELDGSNNLWGATHEHGIFRMVYNTNGANKITRFVNDNENPNSLVSNETNCLEIGKDGNLWAGTQGGISKFTINNQNDELVKIRNYIKKGVQTSTLAHNSVNDILVDQQNNIWIGTRNGLSLLNKDGTFTSWTEQDQFPNALIYCLQDDLVGNIWIGTNDGLVKFHKNSQKFSHYSTSDNIQGREFDTHARYRDENGIIYMGGVDGVTYFDPSKIEILDTPKKLYFSQLRIKEQVIEPSLHENLLKRPIEKTDRINIKHDQFPFYLQFSALDFRLDKNIQYAYRLPTLDTEWNFLTDNEIQFLNLPKGEHTLQINGFSRGAEWAQPPLELIIRVNPPWWSTTLAIIGYILLFFVIVYWFYNFQISRKIAFAESRKLKEIDGLKNALYTNITHEFRTPITIIQGLAETLEDSNGLKTPNSKKSFRLIKENSSNLLKMVNDILDLTKLESAELDVNMTQIEAVGYIKYIFESFESMAMEKQIDYLFYSEVDTLYMDADSEKLATIIKNLIVNAIKFTPKRGKISCCLKTYDRFFVIKIIDSGIGIPKEDLPKVFEKFYQVKNHTPSQYQGTGIGLALAKELTLLMNGSIDVKSEKQKGSEFTIKLPITNQAEIMNLKESKNIWHSDGLEVVVDDFDGVLNTDLDEKAALALIIEDNKGVAYYLKTCLENTYKILFAENGEKGIELAKKYIPDIIISDVMMPKKNGFEVCSILKSEMATNHIPIILLTAKASDKDRIEGLTHGADAYLVKPFNKKELSARIDQLISLRKTMIEKFSKEDFKTFLERKDQEPQTVFIKKVVELVNKSLDNSEFGSMQLAESLHLSESQLYRKIKATTNRSTAVFIRSIRLNKAKLLIQTSNKTISEIAYEVGFNDPSWFSRAFKEEFGKTPSDFA